ncbi:ABC transporter permease [Oscillochloris sp. ZM17-4]|uniref:ABC transporter permease n=1 Tax=Oscillochloris sp. ZM17-4 TaxID=2866714 RepID=UPI001C72E877|nr:ABC transporter permease subunit [Oscillochloris sp. ZM17-4]MBX0331344.1 ABC transporter permease [Oscillochloris sp. ZM17-4]
MNLLSNPVLTRELRGRIRGWRALIILIVYLSITGLITFLVYAASASSFSGGPSDVEAGRGIGKAIFITVMVSTLVQVCVITPALTAGAISGEKERQSYDLLITTLLSPLQIVLGKLASALAFAMLLIFASLPMAGLAFLFGGVSGTELLIGVAGLAATAICYATVGVFWSTVMRSTLAANVMSLGSVIFLLLFIPFIFVVGSLIGGAFSGDPGIVYIYTMGLLLSAHPFIALGITEASLSSGENAFFFTIPSGGSDILVPSPWLVYLFLTALATGLLLVLSVRLLRPVQYEVRRKKGDGG